jgi:hypothetical protein
MVDFVTLSILASILGTSALAITAFLSFRESKRQVKVMEKQLQQSIKLSNPHLKINELKFIEDSLNLGIENVGESNAYDIALMTSVTPYESKDDGNSFIPISNYELKDGNGQKIIGVDGGVLFSYENYNRTYLESKKSSTILITPYFLLQYPKTSKSLVGRSLNLKDLKDFFGQNHLKYALMSYSLVYKNSLSQTLTPLHICRFVIDLETDPSLEAAYNLKRKFGGYVIPNSEVGKQILVLPYEEYKNVDFNPDQY